MSMTTALEPSRTQLPAQRLGAETMSQLVLHGDISKLNAAQKVEYYVSLCQRVGLDPATQPFKILKLQGKEVVYCDRGGAAQLNQLHKVSHEIVLRENVAGCYVVTATAKLPDGRHTTSIGAVPIDNLKGEQLCNAMMKAETKAKRRSTLDLLGLGMLDESEVGSISDAQPMQFNQATGVTQAIPQPEFTTRDDAGVTVTPSRPAKREPLPADKVPKAEVDNRVRDFLANAEEAGHMQVWAYCVRTGRLPKALPLERINPAAVPEWSEVVADLELNDFVDDEHIAHYENLYSKDGIPGLEHESDRTAKEDYAPEPAKPAGEWEHFPMPFGQDAGVTLGKMDRKKLFGWWANYEPKPYKGQISDKDKKFREMLDEAGIHHGFTKKK